MTADDEKRGKRVGHVADTGVFVWIGGPQPERPGPSKFETFGQLTTTNGIVFTISRHAYEELTEDTDSGYVMQDRSSKRQSRTAGSRSLSRWISLSVPFQPS